MNSTCPTRVLRQLKKEKLEAEQAAEQASHRRAAESYRRTRDHSQRNKTGLASSQHGSEIPTTENKDGKSAWSTWLKYYRENAAQVHASPTSTTYTYRY